MAIFFTKVWGFNEPCGPLQFSERGWLTNALDQLRDGDLVALVGTMGPPTHEMEQGRLLGLMEPTRQVAMSLDFPLPTSDEDFNEDGEYKWPYALLNRRAWRLLDRPRLSDISRREFGMSAVLGVKEFTSDEAAKVQRLARVEVPLIQSIQAVARVEGVEVARRRGIPPSTTTRAGVMHLRRAPAYTYAMEIVGAKPVAFKIGWAFDFKSRQRQFNHAALPGLGGLKYQSRLFRLCDTAMQAFRFEQALLQHFASQQHPSNREVIHGISYEQLESTWGNVIQALRLN